MPAVIHYVSVNHESPKFKIMKKIKQLLTLAVLGMAFISGRGIVSAQQPPGWANMDPQQMQQMIQQQLMDTLREQLAITNDADWNAIQGRLAKIVQLKMETMFSSMGGLRGMMGGGRGGGGGQMGGRGGFPGFGQPSQEADALQNAVDAKAPIAQLKATLDRYHDARNRKQAELTDAQEHLREMLTVRQKAILTLMGLLD
jgi:hypothetical protein